MNNQNVIEQIRRETAPILERLADRSSCEFKLKDLEISGSGLTYKDAPLEGAALTKILSTLRVKKNFIDLSHKMSEEDWRLVSNKLKNAEGETKVYGTLSKDENGFTSISNIYNHKEGKKHADDASYSQYLNWIEDALGNSETDYSLKRLDFNRKDDKIDLILLNETERVDVFGTDIDVWKTGDRFHFNGLNFNYAPFFERLSCTNGNVAQQYGFGANISKMTFNNKKIENVINKALQFGNNNLNETLQQAVQHLQANNISLHEFYHYRKFFESRNGEEVYTGLIEKYFNDRPFYQGFGLNVEEKSYKWKSTANTGINAYDFFNMLTYIASHPSEIKVGKDDRAELQIQSSNLLFKKSLDLEDIASSPKIDYPRLVIMN